jgi:hypothetical protein
VEATPSEVLALGAVVAAALVAVARGRRLLVGPTVVAIAFSAVAFGFTPRLRAARSTGMTGDAVAGTPPRVELAAALGYVGSGACLGCHPAEHASFGRTYHRTMTQRPTPRAVLAPLDGRPTLAEGRPIRLEVRAGEVLATLPDPDASPGKAAPDVTRPLALLTGSHREQAFWIAGARPGDLRPVPVVWLVREERFIPRSEAFLTPPDEPLPAVRWGSSCIACHAVAGEPRHDLVKDTFDTRVAELGITCESCHGPGAVHADRHRDPVVRYTQHATKTADPTIVNPARLSPARSAAVCGQCHAYAFPRDEAGWWEAGYARTFRAGDALEPSRTLITVEAMKADPARRSLDPIIEAPASAIFWSDGAVRVGGREYNGLVRSPCFERGTGERQMTCLSCHAMHDGAPAGQIAPSKVDDRACTSCHDGERSRTHSHHQPSSPGAACVACHMPKTSFALLSGVRGHRIESPSVATTLATGRPNACNLCHLDRSLAWTSQLLSRWYGSPEVAIPQDQARFAVAVRDGLAGDAGVRALIADALGSTDAAQATRGAAFRLPLLETIAREDPYPAVRLIAERSRSSIARPRSASLPPSPSFPSASPPAPPPGGDDSLALGPDGRLDANCVRALLAVQDRRGITIAE